MNPANVQSCKQLTNLISGPIVLTAPRRSGVLQSPRLESLGSKVTLKLAQEKKRPLYNSSSRLSLVMTQSVREYMKGSTLKDKAIEIVKVNSFAKRTKSPISVRSPSPKAS